MTWNTSLVCVLLAAILALTYAAKESITVTQDGITFTVDHFDDRRIEIYEVSFEQDGISSNYKFNLDAVVSSINVDTEQYTVLYESNGDLERVLRVDSGARMLQTEDIEDFEEDAILGRRRLYACHDCEEAWEAICDEGVPSVCSIVNYGSPLTDAATASMETFCESFGSACSHSGGEEACEDQCECERSLVISLEWYSAGDLDLHIYEPGGVEVYHGNREGDVGFLDNDNTAGPDSDSDPENYLLYSGLSVDTDNVLGDYTAVVELYGGSGSIPWKLTATSNGRELWVEEGAVADIDGYKSDNFTATVSGYFDYGCANTATL